MNREVLELELDGFDEDSFPEEFEFVRKIQTDFDIEKRYVTYDVIIKRLSDNKYFKGECEDWGQHDGSTSRVWIEVFPKQITITDYI